MTPSEMGDIVVDESQLAALLKAYRHYLVVAQEDAIDRYGGETRVSHRREKQLGILQRFFVGDRLVHHTIAGFVDALDEYEAEIDPQTTEATTAEQMRWFLDGRTELDEIEGAAARLIERLTGAVS